MSINQIQPADNRAVGVYTPYYPANKRTLLPYAITLYQKASLEGKRHIESGDPIPFVATWAVSPLPADMTRFRLQFDGNPDLSYDLMLANFEFVDYLIDVIVTYRRTHTKTTDFSQAFYRKLLRLDE